MTFIAAFAIPGILWTHTGDLWYGKLVGGLFVTNVAVAGVKRLVGDAYPFARPAGARDCDLFCHGGPVAGVPAFPSGHVTTAVCVVTALWLHTGHALILWIGIPWIVAMAWSRWVKRCHNWQQILGGSVAGILAGRLLS